MDSFTVLIVVGLLHCALFFFDTLFKSCSHHPYLYFLENTGLQVEAFRLQWFTTAFNRLFQKCGSWRPKLLDCWFTIGTRFSLLLLPVAMYIVIRTAVIAWQRESGTGDTKPSLVLEPMVNAYILTLQLSECGSCSLVGRYHLWSRMWVIYPEYVDNGFLAFFKTLVQFYQTACCHSSEDYNLSKYDFNTNYKSFSDISEISGIVLSTILNQNVEKWIDKEMLIMLRTYVPVEMYG